MMQVLAERLRADIPERWSRLAALELVLGEVVAEFEDESVVPETVEIVEEPEPWSSEIALPATGWPEPSFRVTVIVEVLELSATRLAGLAVTVETDAEAAPTPKFTPAVCVSVTESVVSVAV